MRPERDNIAAPELPGRLRWLNAGHPPRMAELTAAGPVLVHFFDFAQLNSVRALPYAIAWERRYRGHGLTVLGIHSPRFPFTAERGALEPALGRLGVRHRIADDSKYAVWHDYGCRGWPSLFLWGQDGALRWFHHGEGEYAATERAITDQLAVIDPGFQPPPPLEPLRASDAADTLVAPPSEELFPGGSAREPWSAADGTGTLELSYEAGSAHASFDGLGELRVDLDGVTQSTIAIDAPGLHTLAEHPRHERHELRLEPSPRLELYSISFAAGVP